MFVDCEDFPFSGGWVDSSCFHNQKLGCASATVAVNNPHAVPPQEMWFCTVLLSSAWRELHSGRLGCAFFGRFKIAGKSTGSMGGLHQSCLPQYAQLFFGGDVGIRQLWMSESLLSLVLRKVNSVNSSPNTPPFARQEDLLSYTSAIHCCDMGGQWPAATELLKVLLWESSNLEIQPWWFRNNLPEMYRHTLGSSPILVSKYSGNNYYLWNLHLRGSELGGFCWKELIRRWDHACFDHAVPLASHPRYNFV